MEGIITDRRSHINASDVAIVMGLNYSLYENKRGEICKEYEKSKLRLYNEKLGLFDSNAILDDISQARLERMQLGIDYEPVAFEHYKRTLEKGFKAKYQPGKINNDKYAWLCGHPDGLIYKDGQLVNGWEHKAVYKLTDYESCEDFVEWVKIYHPMHWCQCQVYMLLSGVEWDLQYTEIGKRYIKLAPIRIPHDYHFQDLIVKATKQFWYYYIVGNQIRMRINKKRIEENKPIIGLPLPIDDVQSYDFSISEGIHELDERQSNLLAEIMSLKESEKSLKEQLEAKRTQLETELDAIDKNEFVSNTYKLKKIKVKGSNKLNIDKLIALNNGISFDGCYDKGDAHKQWRYNVR